MNLNFLVFLIPVLSVILGAHWLAYFSVVRFLSISSFRAKAAILAILAFLFCSFFIAAALVRLWPNILTKIYYALATFWMGMLINLLMALALAWAVIGVIRLLHRTPNLLLIGGIFFIAALAYSFFGLWQAFHPVVKKIDITIDGLPDNWKGKKIVQISDLHLGNINGPRFFERVIKKVNALDAEAVMITGDLFDGMGADLERFNGSFNDIKSKKGVFFVRGNHEIYLGLDKAYSALKGTNINILDKDVVDLDGLQIVGLAYPEFTKTVSKADLEEVKEKIDPNEPSILLYHAPTNIDTSNGNGHASLYWKPDNDLSTARDLGIDLQLSGHTHAGQIFPFNLLAKMIYAGNDYGLHREDGLQLYTTSGTGTWGPPMRTGSKSEIVLITLR